MACVTSIATSSSPLIRSLPVELCLTIADFLDAEYVASQDENTPHPLLALRAVHSRFYNVGKRLLFKHAKPLKASNFHTRVATAAAIGYLIQKITINIKDLDPAHDALFSTIVESFQKLDDLTLIYDKDDEQARPELIKSLCRLGSMSKLKVEEADIDMMQVPAGHEEAERSPHFVDHAIGSIFSSENIRIQSFAHICSVPFHPSVFHILRTQPTQLRTLVIRASIQDGLRESFNEPIRWSSAATLEKLIIRSCSGTHYATIGRHVASGLFGNLKRLVVIGSGYIDDNLLGLRRPKLSIRPLDLLEIDHAFGWEVLALSIIPAREVHLTRVLRRAIVNALDQEGWAGLKILKVQKWSDEADRLFPGFKQACTDRGVQLLDGANPYGRCTCHEEWVAGTKTMNIGL